MQNRRESITLSGTWDFRFDGDREWRAIAVPGCWDALDGVAKNISGPAWYRKRIDIPREFAGKLVWLRFDAVSYLAEIYVNGQLVGRHTGAWDAFTAELRAEHLERHRPERLVAGYREVLAAAAGRAGRP